MKKITVHIAAQQYVRLKALADVLGMKQAELLRRFLEEGLVQAEQERQQQARHSSMHREEE